MEPKEIIAAFRQDLTVEKEKGRTQIDVSALEAYFDNMEKAAGESIEHRKILSAHALAQYDAEVRQSIANFEAVMGAGKEAINAVIIINGGAVVVLMAFLGT